MAICLGPVSTKTWRQLIVHKDTSYRTFRHSWCLYTPRWAYIAHGTTSCSQEQPRMKKVQRNADMVVKTVKVGVEWQLYQDCQLWIHSKSWFYKSYKFGLIFLLCQVNWLTDHVYELYKWIEVVFHKINACFAAASNVFPVVESKWLSENVTLTAREVIRQRRRRNCNWRSPPMLHWKSPWKFPHISKAVSRMIDWKTENSAPASDSFE